MVFPKLESVLRRNTFRIVLWKMALLIVLLGILIFEEWRLNSSHLILSISWILLICFSVIFIFYLFRSRNGNFLIADFILESSEMLSLFAVDLNYRFIALNQHDIDVMEEFFGFTPRIGEVPFTFLGEEEAVKLKENIDKALEGVTFTSLDIIDKKGETLYWQNIFSPIYNNRRKIIGVSCIVLDITEQKKNELANQKLIYQDSLTTLFNRRYLELAFEEIQNRKEDNITLIIADLDDFKEINDRYGHHEGDQLLIEFGNCLTKYMPASAVVARLGGDEFAILLSGVPYPTAKMLITLVQNEMKKGAHKLSISYGVYSNFYNSNLEFSDFYKKADHEMYQYKMRGKTKK